MANSIGMAGGVNNPDYDPKYDLFTHGKTSDLIRYLDPSYAGVGMPGEMATTDDWDQYNVNRQRALDQAKAIDPNASYADGPGGLLQFDRSKLPAFKGGNENIKYVNQGLTNLWDTGSAGRVKDPSKVLHDPNYGDYTAAGNLSTAPGDSDSGFMGQLGKYMPSAISALMSMASGIPVASLVQGAAAADSGDWKGMSMENLLASIAGMIANRYIPGASTAIGLANGAMKKGL